ncbi:hypothetical protein [Mycobacterium syngnathidarum]
MPEIHLDVFTDVDRRSLRRSVDEIDRHFKRSTAAISRDIDKRIGASYDQAANRALRANERIRSSQKKMADDVRRSTREAAAEHKRGLADELAGIQRIDRARMRAHDRELATLDRLDSRRDRLHRRELDRIGRESLARQRALQVDRRGLGGRDRDPVARSLRAAGAAVGAGSRSATHAAQIGAAGSDVAGQLAQVGSSGRGAGMVALTAAAGPLAAALFTVASAAATASQSVFLIPAAATAAGAAFGSLKIGASGFFDTIGDIRDPEKFAAGLQGLSGNAQQAALSIQSLLPQFDALKMRAQDALFSGVGQQVEALVTTLGPTIENMVIRINSAFNGMFNGLADRLMTPEMQSAITNLTDNMATAFEQLQPAVADVAAAFTDMASSGSNVLPDIASAAADAAKAFAGFISETTKSGEFEARLREGLKALRDLVGVIGEVSGAMFDMLEIAGPGAIKAIQVAGKVVSGIFKAIEMAIKGTIGQINTLIKLYNSVPFLPDVGLIPAGVGALGANPYSQGGIGATAGVPTGIGPAPGAYAPHRSPVSGVGGSLGTGLVQGGTGWGGGGATPRGGDGASLPAYVDPSQWEVPAMAPAGLTGAPGYGGGQVDPGEVFRAEGDVLSAKNSLEEARLRLINLEQKGNASQLELLRARHDVAERERSLTEAQMKLAEARAGSTEKIEQGLKSMTGALDELGVALDSDLGASKGLAGLADNLVRFLGSIAFADTLGRLSAIKQHSMAEAGLSESGMGLAGMFLPPVSSGGMMDYGPAAIASYPYSQFGAPASLTRQPYGLPASTNTGGYGSSGAVFPPWVHELERIFGVKASTYPGHQTGNRNEAGYAPNPNGLNRGIDWSGPVDAMQRFADYLATVPGSLEQVIWQNPNTGRSTEIAGGRAQPGYFSGDLGGHRDHVHTRQSSALPVPGGSPSLSVPTPSLGVPTGPLTPGLGLPSGGSLPGMGAGMPNAAPLGISPGQGGFQPSGGGFSGLGGLPMAAVSGAATAAGGAFGGPAGAAGAEMAMKAINRTIGFAGQAAGIGVQGLGETFLPHGSALGDLSNNLLFRVAAGFAGAKPATASTAAQQEIPGKPKDPNSAQHGQGGSPGQGNQPLIGTMNYTGPQSDGQKVAKDIQRKTNSYGAAGKR